MRLYSQNMPNQLSTHNISGTNLHWLVRYSPSKSNFISKRLKQVVRVIFECLSASKILFVSLEHIEVFLVIFSETSETGHEGFHENWVI